MIPKIQNFGPLKCNISKIVISALHIHYSLTSARRGLSKNVTHGESIVRKKYVAFFEHFCINIFDKREIQCCVVKRRLCVTRRRSTKSAAYRANVDGTLLPAVMDQIFVDNHDS